MQVAEIFQYTYLYRDQYMFETFNIMQFNYSFHYIHLPNKWNTCTSNVQTMIQYCLLMINFNLCFKLFSTLSNNIISVKSNNNVTQRCHICYKIRLFDCNTIMYNSNIFINLLNNMQVLNVKV